MESKDTFIIAVAIAIVPSAKRLPKKPGVRRECWDLLPVPYFHNVFTLPHELNPLILKSEANQRILLKLLFDATAQTLLAFGEQELRGKVGFTLVLHTWDQQLRPHFHLHCSIASGALAHDGRWVAGGNQFLFPVRGLSKMFRGKFLVGLKSLLAQQALELPESLASPIRQRQLVKRLFKKPWVVYSKAPFAGPAKLLDYLSRYTHRVAITNSRLKACRNGEVVFSYRDRQHGSRRKQLSLPVSQFIGRFLTHVLPERFMRIRHYGFMANRSRKQNLVNIRNSIGAKPTAPSNAQASYLDQWLKTILGIERQNCPCCGGHLIETELPHMLKHRNTTKPTSEATIVNLTRGPP